MTNEPDLINRIAAALASHVRPALPIAITLWNIDMIAQYLVRSSKVVRERIVTLPDFPQPIRLPSVQSDERRGVRSQPRWKAAEVIRWAESYQEARPRR